MAPYSPRRGEPLALFAVGAAGKDQIFGDHLVLQDLLVVVDVLDECIQGKDPLLEPGFDLLPIAAGNDAGNDVEGENLFGALIAAVDIEGDAHIEQQRLGGLILDRIGKGKLHKVCFRPAGAAQGTFIAARL